MQIDVLEQTDTKLVFNLKGASHTFCNALKDELTNDENVNVATYTKTHPVVSDPRVYLEMKEGSPHDALENAIERLREKNAGFEKAAVKALK